LKLPVEVAVILVVLINQEIPDSVEDLVEAVEAATLMVALVEQEQEMLEGTLQLKDLVVDGQVAQLNKQVEAEALLVEILQVKQEVLVILILY
tara:strand:+ start:120 stop:398 length:279 start_codon:yes stop_codon:yes gene_type:complete